MRYLLDSNIVLRLANESTAEHALIRQALREMVTFWNVCTRPARVNGFGWEVERIRTEVERLLLRFPLLPEASEVFDRWLSIVTTHEVKGKQVHNARLAAAAQVHGIEQLLTLNVEDFKRFDMASVHPREVGA